MEQSKFSYALYSACFFIIVFALASANIWLGAVIGLAIGYLLGYLHDLNTKIKNLQKFIEQQKAAKQSTVIATVEPPAVKSVTSEPGIIKTNIAQQPAINIPKSASVITPSAMDLWGQKFLQAIKNYFTTGNMVVKTGIIVLLFGIGFLLQYAANNGWLPLKVLM